MDRQLAGAPPHVNDAGNVLRMRGLARERQAALPFDVKRRKPTGVSAAVAFSYKEA